MHTPASRWTRSLTDEGEAALARPAGSVWLLAVGPALLALLALLLGALRGLDLQRAFDEFLVSTLVAAVASGAVGAWILSRQPKNRIGWLFCAFGMGAGLTAAAGQYALYALFLDPSTVPGAPLVGWVNRWFWLLGMVLPAAVLLLLFPSGRALSPRWRMLGWVDVLGIVLVALASAFSPTRLPNLPDVANPFGWESAAPVLDAILALSAVVLVGSMCGGIASLAARYRRARGEEREPLKWFAYTVALMVAAVRLRPVLEVVAVPLSAPAILLTRIVEAAAMVCLPVGASQDACLLAGDRREFQPPYDGALNVIAEVSAGLVELCLAVRRRGML